MTIPPTSPPHNDPDAPQSERGGKLPTPYYDDGDVVIYHGDCRDILPLLPKVDLVLTDPPYGLNFHYLSYSDTRDSLKQLIKTTFPLLRTISERIYVLCGPTQIHLYPEPKWICSVTWNTTGSFGKYGYSQWTPVLCYGNDIQGFGSINGRIKSDVISINGGAGVGFQRTVIEKGHTCPKPENMMKLLVGRLSKPAYTLLDPFLGSGTTIKAVKDTGGRGIGIDIEEKYCEIAAKRMGQGVLC
jgi:site-specific DNA-methyltransferase (adenine-specific)